MYNQLSLKAARKYQRLLAAQFTKIGRSLVISDEKTWELFLTHEESNEITREHLPIVKSILLGKPIVPIDVFRDIAAEALKKYHYCPVIRILMKMTDGELMPELVQHSLKMTADVLRPEALPGPSV